MIRVIVSDQQARAIGEADQIVELCDREGRVLGMVVSGIGEDDVRTARAVADSTERRYTTPEVLEHLRSLGSS